MLGYWNGSDKIQEPWQGDWFLSGDLARQDAEGNFFFEGRRDDVITAGGYRISPLEVESILNQHPEVEESAVIGRNLGEGKTIVEAYLVLVKSEKPLKDIENTFSEFLEGKLAKYKIPRGYHCLAQLPKTVTGKIKRRALVQEE
ncbi:MAG: AMP-binding protein, partial [bacterium]|nr:AMP-binding protein [bacterium]